MKNYKSCLKTVQEQEFEIDVGKREDLEVSLDILDYAEMQFVN